MLVGWLISWLALPRHEDVSDAMNLARVHSNHTGELWKPMQRYYILLECVWVVSRAKRAWHIKVVTAVAR